MWIKKKKKKKNLEIDGRGNPICSSGTLHQGNSRQRGSCKDDIDRFEIPLFPPLDIRLPRLPDISLPGIKESHGRLITTVLSAAKKKKESCWIYLSASPGSLMSSTFHFIARAAVTVTQPNSKNAGREIPVCFCQVNLRETVSGNRTLGCEIKVNVVQVLIAASRA